MTLPLGLCSILVLTLASVSALHLSDGDKQFLVDKHNEIRRKEGASYMPDLYWEKDLAWLAQTWTDKCHFSHQLDQPWGENLATRSSNGHNNHGDIEYMINLWVNEKTFNRNGTFEECCSRYAHNCCHYTQVVWARTTRIGCGMTMCKSLVSQNQVIPNSVFLACYYNPPGNSPVSHCTWDWRPYH